MRWSALALVVGLACAAALTGADAGDTVGKMGEAQAQYSAEEMQVVGTMLSTERMYVSEEDVSEKIYWDTLDMRVDTVESKNAKSKPGEVIAVQYQWKPGPRPRMPGPGDLIRVRVQRVESNGKQIWVAPDGLERVGRGEFVNPGENPALDLGSAEAKVLVKLLAPLQYDCHQETVGLLKELAAREPERVRVQIFDMGTTVGRMEMMRERIRCASVLVNNRYEFELDGRKITMWHKPNGPNSPYNSEDAVAVAERELARLYAAPESGNRG